MTVVEGQRRFEAPRERVFELLTRPDVVASALPVVRSYEVVDADHWRAKVKPPLPLAPAITVRFEVLERRPPSHAALHAHGGGADVTSRFDLEDDDDGGTLMRWRTDLHFAGLLDRLAGHGLDGLAQRQADRTLDAVDRAL